MRPGAYLRLRRQAAGLGLDELPIPGTSVLAIERDARRPMDIELWALSMSFSFDFVVLGALYHGVIDDICRVCGCTEMDACLDQGVGCHWVERDLCSACAHAARPLPEGLAA